jgi:hypothetical protein
VAVFPSASACLLTAAKNIWTLAPPCSVVFAHLPQFTRLRNALFAPPTYLWSSPVPQPEATSTHRSLFQLVQYCRRLRRPSNNHERNCLTLKCGNTYNIPHAEVAQVVEQRTENPRVSSSTLLLGTSYAFAERALLGGTVPSSEHQASQPVGPSGVNAPEWRKGRRDSLKNCWGATPVSVRIRPSAPYSEALLPGCVAVAQRTLDPLAQVRILARQPCNIGTKNPNALTSKQRP